MLDLRQIRYFVAVAETELLKNQKPIAESP